MLPTKYFTKLKQARSHINMIKQAKSNMSWKPEMLALVLSRKKELLAQVGISMHYFVLERHDDDDQFQQFLDHMETNLDCFADGTILSVAIRAGTHWTALNIKITQGNLQVFCMDARFHPIADRHVKDLLSVFANAIVFKFEPDRVMNPNTQSKELRRIQISDIGCGIFTLDHLFCMLEGDMFTKLMQDKEHKTINLLTAHNFYAVYPENFTDVLAILLRTTQVKAYIDLLPTSVKNSSVTTKGTSLEKFAKYHYKQPSEKKSYDNHAINERQVYFCQLAEDIVLTVSNQRIEHIIQSRQGFNYLAKLIMSQQEFKH